MLKVIVRGVRHPEDVKAAEALGADGVAFVVESKEDPANRDVTEIVEVARLTPPLLSVVLETTTREEARLRRAIGSVHPHVVVLPADVDPMVLADLQVSFPDVKWFARLSATDYEPFHDAADGLVFPVDDVDAVASVKEATRSRVLLEGVTEADAATAVTAVKPFAVTITWTDADAVTRVVDAARAAAKEA